MSEKKTDPWALLREARNELAVLASYVGHPDTKWPTVGLMLTAVAQKKLHDRIDAALSSPRAAQTEGAERQDSATDVVEWKRMNGRAFMSALIGRCDVDLFSKEGGGWWWQVRANGDEKTIDEAKSAAIAAAKGMK